MKNQMKSSFLAIASCVSMLIPTADARSSKNVNPALLYWQAAADLPALTDTQAKELRDVAAGKIELKAELIEGLDLEHTVGLLQKAAASEVPCEWGLAWEEGLEMRTPHLVKLREFTVLVLVLAEAKFSKGETSEGIDLLVIAHHIARDAGAAPSMLSIAVQNAMEMLVIKNAARHCMSWNAAARNDYLARLTTLPDPTRLILGFAGELAWVDVWENELEDDFEKAIKKIPFSPAKNGEQLKSHEGIKKLVVNLRKRHVEGMAVLKLKGDSRRKAVVEFEKQLVATRNVPANLLSAIMMPSLKNMVRSEDRIAIAHEMLETVLEHGPMITVEDIEEETFELERKQGELELKADELDFALTFGKSS